MAGGCPNDPAKVMQNLKCVIEALKKTFSCPPACPGECCKGPAPPFPPKEPMLLVEDTSLKPVNILFDPKSINCQTPRNTSKESLSMSNKKRSKDGRYVKAYRPKIYRLESCKGSQSVCCLQRLPDTELRGGNFVKCVCKKHYGLQDLCERTGCQGSPYSASNPARCGPSYFNKTYIGKTASKPRYYQIVRQKLSDLNRRRYMKLIRVPSETCFEATVDLVQPQFDDATALINPQFEDAGESTELIKSPAEDTKESTALIKSPAEDTKPKLYALISLGSESEGADTARSNPESVYDQTSKPHHHHHHHRKFICKYCNKENEVSSSSKESSSDSNGSNSEIKVESKRIISKVDISIQSDVETHVRLSKKQNTTNEKPSEPYKSAQTIDRQIEPRSSSVSKQSTQTVERRMIPYKPVASKQSGQTIDGQIEPRDSSASSRSATSVEIESKPRVQTTQTIERYFEPRKPPGTRRSTQTVEELFTKKILKNLIDEKHFEPRKLSVTKQSTQTVEATAQQKKMLRILTDDSGTRKSKTKYTKLQKKRATYLEPDLSTSECKDSSSTPKCPSQTDTCAQTDCPCIHLKQFCNCNVPETPVEQEESSPRSSAGSLELLPPIERSAAIEDVKDNEDGSTNSFYALNFSVAKSKPDRDSDKDESSAPNNTPTLGSEDSSGPSGHEDSPFDRFCEPNFANFLEMPTITENPYIKMPFRPNLTTILDSEDASGNKECRCCRQALKVDDCFPKRDDIEVIKENSAFLESDVCTSAAVTDLSSSGLSVQYEYDAPSIAKAKNGAAKQKKKVRFNSCPDLCCDDQ